MDMDPVKRNGQRDGFETIFDTTERIMDMDPVKRREMARGILGYLFLEPSTRTRLSFTICNGASWTAQASSLGIYKCASSSKKRKDFI